MALQIRIGDRLIPNPVTSINEAISVDTDSTGSMKGKPHLIIELSSIPNGVRVVDLFSYVKENHVITIIDGETGEEIDTYTEYDYVTNAYREIMNGANRIMLTVYRLADTEK